MTALNRILGSRRGAVLHLRIEGRAIAPQCPHLKDYVARAFADGVAQLRLDLSECTYGDSTFVGTLLQLRKQSASRHAEPLPIIANAEFQSILRNMGLLRLFVVNDAAAARPEMPSATSTDDAADVTTPDEWEELAIEAAGPCSPEMIDNVIEAHSELMLASDTCQQRYGAIVQQARDEQARRQQAGVGDCPPDAGS
ncbi:MAG: STAS domain-containing protein [Planctomycetaceae bacterium]